ncbi:ferritin-like protein [Streptomyces sp. AV19]|uniref:ferritin-like domain-containing protein n=1 Tax=Streptomyces sp. AV19 TaxID=2793068 RepID=UPI0018FE3C35|nr:ferritin-like protein [Streptomyces sp. AV19]MBH1938568.1 ferritin-like protein [Streptomyces sp. AV19]MDG4535219.1 ferritin-like protein [Streptomyces sp. AV19]
MTGNPCPDADPCPPGPAPAITTLEDLTQHLVAAAKVELSTIPLYLYATYSIKTKGYSQWAAGKSAQNTMIGVAIEEMLHLTLVRNLLVAIGSGDAIRLYSTDFTDPYPKRMLQRCPCLPLHLRRVSKDQIGTFMQIEWPEDRTHELLADVHPYHTLGEFYARIEKGLEWLSSGEAKEHIDWDKAKRELWKFQYHRGYWNANGGSDTPLIIVDKDSAIEAMKVIVDQGEGAGTDGLLPDPIVRDDDYPPEDIGKFQASHFTKFEEIQKGLNGIGVVCDDNGKQKFTIDDSEVIWPLLDDPALDKLVKDRPVYKLTEFSNAVYCYVLALLDAIYARPMTPYTDDAPFHESERYGLERGFVAVMQGIVYPVADLLVRTPLTQEDMRDVCPPDPLHAGPPFEHYQFVTKNPKGELVALCNNLLADYPELGGDDGVQRQISLLPDITLP